MVGRNFYWESFSAAFLNI